MSTWGDESYLERDNRALLNALHSAHPEYSSLFGAVIAEAVQKCRTGGYRTVEDAKKPAN
jgi:hypothetical protein